jgi:hypothetical protein
MSAAEMTKLPADREALEELILNELLRTSGLDEPKTVIRHTVRSLLLILNAQSDARVLEFVRKVGALPDDSAPIWIR